MTAALDTTTFIADKLRSLRVDPALAIIFPGQGSQMVPMGRDAAHSSPIARQVFEQADRILKMNLSELCFEGPQDELTRTENAQPAILTASLAVLIAAESGSLDRRPAFVAGHSLGEYTALVAAGSLSFEDALTLVRERGRLMERSGQEQSGTMAAIVGLNEGEVAQICELTGSEVSNYNSPTQIVVGGPPVAVERACQLAKERGGRGLPLNVAGAFHTSLMRSAAQEFARSLVTIAANDPVIRVVGNVTGTSLDNAAAVMSDLEEQITSPVLWHQSLTFMIDQGIRSFIEVGPGRTLTAILKRSYPAAAAISIDGDQSDQCLI